ncbi:TetR/AcrR family transcriptional regulator [Psychromicrobium lacuslunae]|uniref:TetR family transcriptional regulator n=1 Tax=Psychromicrobium lacuslunae TaxID=1618207 RepID=A0A0D4BYR2_9MICC|nr:TetR family transcriptional regulator C-terminal domain-containing protein [Psychromicrobium lacuslunae]AJT41478.1 hypothetical protein UM93_08025 [Psychromicrobium lacuslunae]
MPRPKKFDADLVSDQVLDEFWTNSFSGTSTDDLCQRTGLSRSSLYNAFSNKSGAYRHALDHYGKLKDAQRSPYAEYGSTGREALTALLHDVITGQLAEADRRTCLVLHACVEIGTKEADIAELTRENLAVFEDLICSIVERGQADGSLRNSQPPRELARLVHAVLNGLQVHQRVAETDENTRSTINTVMTLL